MLSRRKLFGWLGAAVVAPVLPKLAPSFEMAGGYEIPGVTKDEVLQAAEYSWSQAAPCISFCNDTDTGIYRSEADTIELSVRGKKVHVPYFRE